MNKNDYIIISEGLENGKPLEPYEGYQYWNDTTNHLEVYKNNVWKSVYNTPTGEILEGESYTINIESNKRVIMGNVDITNLISNGVLTVQSVIGDIIITD